MVFLLVVLLAFLLSALYTGGQLLALRASGVQASELGVGLGPTLATFRVGLTRVVVRALPLSLQLSVGRPDESCEDAALRAALTENAKAFERLSLFKRGLVDFAGVLPLALLALILLGPGAGGESILRGVPQLLEGAWSPRSVGAGLVRACLQLYEREGALALAGVLASKLAALQFLPFVSSCLGRQLLEPLRPADGAGPAPLHAYARMGLALLTLVFGLCWLAACAAA